VATRPPERRGAVGWSSRRPSICETLGGLLIVCTAVLRDPRNRPQEDTKAIISQTGASCQEQTRHGCVKCAFQGQPCNVGCPEGHPTPLNPNVSSGLDLGLALPLGQVPATIVRVLDGASSDVGRSLLPAHVVDIGHRILEALLIEEVQLVLTMPEVVVLALGIAKDELEAADGVTTRHQALDAAEQVLDLGQRLGPLDGRQRMAPR